MFWIGQVLGQERGALQLRASFGIEHPDRFREDSRLSGAVINVVEATEHWLPEDGSSTQVECRLLWRSLVE